jgi:hypothetical protein
MSSTLEIIQNELLANNFAKKISYGVAGAAIVSAAFFVGYQAAKRHHSKKFHIRDAEKNEHVSFFISFFFFGLKVFFVSIRLKLYFVNLN